MNFKFQTCRTARNVEWEADDVCIHLHKDSCNQSDAFSVFSSLIHQDDLQFCSSADLFRSYDNSENLHLNWSNSWWSQQCSWVSSTMIFKTTLKLWCLTFWWICLISLSRITSWFTHKQWFSSDQSEWRQQKNRLNIRSRESGSCVRSDWFNIKWRVVLRSWWCSINSVTWCSMIEFSAMLSQNKSCSVSIWLLMLSEK